MDVRKDRKKDSERKVTSVRQEGPNENQKSMFRWTMQPQNAFLGRTLKKCQRLTSNTKTLTTICLNPCLDVVEDNMLSVTLLADDTSRRIFIAR